MKRHQQSNKKHPIVTDLSSGHSEDKSSVIEKHIQTERDNTSLCVVFSSINSRSLKFLSEGLPPSLSKTLIFSPKLYPNIATVLSIAPVTVCYS